MSALHSQAGGEDGPEFASERASKYKRAWEFIRERVKRVYMAERARARAERAYMADVLTKLVLPRGRKIDILAHSNGGAITVGTLMNMPEILPAVNKLAFTDSYHHEIAQVLQHGSAITTRMKR